MPRLRKGVRLIDYPLDFAAEQSVCTGTSREIPMDAAIAGPAIKACLQEIQIRLDDAASISKAASACAQAGNAAKGVEIALDIEQFLHDVTGLLGAASIISRLAMKKME